MNNQNKRITGFTETLQTITKSQNINTNVCLPIYMNGMNSNKINFLQSEFPNLTKIKPLIRLTQNSLNQYSVKVETPKSGKKVKLNISNKPNTKIKPNTKKKKFSFSMPSKTKPKPKSKTKTKKVNFAVY
jgi:hypothetical protein